MDGFIDEIIAQAAKQDVIDTNASIRDGVAALVEYAKAARAASDALLAVNSNGQLVSAFNEAAKAQNKLIGQTSELEKLQAKLSGLEAEQAKQIIATKVAIQEKTKALTDEARANNESYQTRQKDIQGRKADVEAAKQQRAEEKEKIATEKEHAKIQAQAERDREAERKQLASLTNDYALLSTAYNEAALRAKNLQIQLGANHVIAKEATADAAKLGAELKRLDASVGQHSRNVGNYGVAFDRFGNSIQQILRELPAAAVSWNTFFLGISNNLPMFFDEIKRVRQEQKLANELQREQVELTRKSTIEAELFAGATLLEAEATAASAVATQVANTQKKATPGILSLIGKSLFSFNTLLTLGVVALTFYGAKILEWGSALINGTDIVEGMTEAIKKNTEALNSEVAKLKQVEVTLNSTSASRDEVLKSIADAKTDYPVYLGFLTEENRLTKQVNEAIELQIDAFKRRAISQTYVDVYTKSLEKVIELEQDVARVAEGNTTLWERFRARVTNSGYRGTDIQALQLNILQKNIRLLNEEIDKNEKAYDNARNPQEAFTRGIREQIFNEQALIREQEDYINKLKQEYTYSPLLVKAARERIATYKDLIKAQERQIELADKIFSANQSAPDFTLTQAEIGQKRIEAAMLTAQKGSDAAKQLSIQNEIALNQVAVNSLRKRYIETNKIREADLKNNASYQAELALLEAQTARKIYEINNSDKKKKPRDTTNNDIKLIQDMEKARAEEEVKFILLQAENQKIIAENEENSLTERLEALNDYYKKKDEAIKKGNDGEINALRKTLQAIDIIEKKRARGGKLTPQESDLLKERELLNQRLTNVELDGQLNRTKNQRDYQQGINSLIKKASQEELAIILRQTDAIAAARSEQFAQEKEALDEQFNRRLLSVREYNIAVKALNLEYAKDTLTQQIDQLNEQILFSNLTQDEIDKIIAKIKDLEKTRNNLGKSGVKRGADGGILGFTEKEKKDLENISTYADAGKSALQGVADVFAQYSERRRAQLDAEMDAIDKRTKKEIAGINASAASQEEKDRQIAEATARGDAQKEALAEKQKQRDIADAKRQKAIKIAQIIVETALAVVHQLGSGDPYTAIARGIAAGAAGAAQLAVAIATPIPSFADGVDSFDGGMARYGEAGPELVKEPNKAPYWVTEETIAPLPKGTRIIPEDKVIQSAYASMLTPELFVSLQKQKEDYSGVENRLDKWGARQVQALKDLKQKPQRTSIFGSQNKEWINN